MSFALRDAQINMSRCAKCGADLIVRDNRKTKQAKVFCSNKTCKFHRKSHPTGSMLNEGPNK